MMKLLPLQYKPLKLQAKAIQSEAEVGFVDLMRGVGRENKDDGFGYNSTASSQLQSLLTVALSFFQVVLVSAFKACVRTTYFGARSSAGSAS